MGAPRIEGNCVRASRRGAPEEAPLLTLHAVPGNDERSVLTQRERQIVALVAQGLKNKQVAERLPISDQTVKQHLQNIFGKVGVGNRFDLALYAFQNEMGASGTPATAVRAAAEQSDAATASTETAQKLA